MSEMKKPLAIVWNFVKKFWKFISGIIVTGIIIPFIIGKIAGIDLPTICRFMTSLIEIPIWIILVVMTIVIILIVLVFYFVPRKNSLVFNPDDGLCYHPDDKEHSAPFCPRCYEAEHLKIHLQLGLVCPKCDKSFKRYSPDDIMKVF
jgi:uncharacterized protein (DUF983 family)